MNKCRMWMLLNCVECQHAYELDYDRRSYAHIVTHAHPIQSRLFVSLTYIQYTRFIHLYLRAKCLSACQQFRCKPENGYQNETLLDAHTSMTSSCYLYSNSSWILCSSSLLAFFSYAYVDYLNTQDHRTAHTNLLSGVQFVISCAWMGICLFPCLYCTYL